MSLRDPRPESGWSVLRDAALLAGLAVLAAGLRLFGLTNRSLSFDEAFSVQLARSGLSRMLALLRSVEPHPPLHPLLLKVWAAAFGDGEFAIRGLSVLLSVAVVLLSSAFAARLAGRRVGLLTGLLVAVSPFQVMAAQEARMYPLLTLLALGASAALWEALEGRRAWWIVYAALGALAVYTHYFAALVLLAHALYVAIVDRRRSSVRRWLLAATGMALLFVPWLPAFVGQLLSGSAWPSFRPPLGLRAAADLAAMLGFGGYLFGTGSYWSLGTLPLFAYLPLLMPFALLLAAGAGWPAVPRASRLFLLALLAVPAGAALVISLKWNIFYPRYFSFLIPPFAILTALGMSHLDMALTARRGGAIAAALVCLLAYGLPVLQALHTAPYFRVYDWRGAASYVARHARPDDLIILVPAFGSVPFDYYFPGPQRRLELTPQELRAAWSGVPRAASVLTPVLAQPLLNHPRLWLVATGPLEPAAWERLSDLLTVSFVSGEGRDFKNVVVFLWERRKP